MKTIALAPAGLLFGMNWTSHVDAGVGSPLD